MSKTIEVGKRVVPVEQIALVEQVDPETLKNMRSERPFKSRIFLLNRDTILSEADPFALAEELGFRILLKDNVATSPAVDFSVERFEPTTDFQPSKPFVSRLMWRSLDGKRQSKLMLTEVDDLIEGAVRGQNTKNEGLAALSPRQARRPRRRTKLSGGGVAPEV